MFRLRPCQSAERWDRAAEVDPANWTLSACRPFRTARIRSGACSALVR
jgi:hypothetical protein